MKIAFFLCTLILTSSFTFDNGQCDIGRLQNKAQAALSDFAFIKQFPVEISENKKIMEISYVLSVNSVYRIAVADNGIKGQRLIIKLYDRNKKIITSNVIHGTRDFNSSIDFQCPATGVYFIEASGEKNNEVCGIVILGFKRSNEFPTSTEAQ